MYKRRVLFLVCIVLFSISLANQFHAGAISATIKVPEDYLTIQAAIDHANAGDIIQVSSGIYYENLFIDKSLTLVGQNKIDTVIIGNGLWDSVIQANFTTVNISGFTIANGTNGIMLETCTKSTIKDNNVNAQIRGIWLYHSHNNTVIDNVILENGWVGIVLCGRSSDNLVMRNTIENKTIGMELTGRGNFIYHNNFINNKNQTLMTESFNNTWNNSLEGNYWSIYEGKDENQDGIGDTPYIIDGNNQDNYPLMGIFTQFQVSNDGQNYYVATISNSTITGLDVGDSISFDITGPDGTTGFCRIAIQRILLDGDPEILIDGSVPILQKELSASNSTYLYLYFVYNHSTHRVVITPETLAITLLIGLVLCVIVAWIVIKKVRSKKETDT